MLRVYKEWYTVEKCGLEKDALFIFGDNTVRRGTGGQARIRNLRNSVGIATKQDPGIFFSDDDLARNITHISKDIEKIEKFLKKGKTVYWPQDGIGTGLSNMKEKCPQTFIILVLMIKSLFERYGEVDTPPSPWGDEVIQAFT